MIRLATCLFALTMLCACEPAPGGGAPSAKTSAKTAVTTAPSGSASGKGPTTAASTEDPMDKEDIPVPEDFEEDAEKAVTDDTVDDEVEKLDKEIKEDKE